jgi:hypothetical protein
MKIPEGGQFENPPCGSHVARCIGVIDLGTQQHKGFQGQPDWASRDVRIIFELPLTRMTGVYNPELKGKPFGCAMTLKQSLHQSSKLRKMLRGWRGKDFTKEEIAAFDLSHILGRACMLSLVENGDYVNIDTISALPLDQKTGKPTLVPKQINPTTFFSLDPQEFDVKAFSGLSEKAQAKIKASPEYAALFSESQSGSDDDQHMPEEPGGVDADGENMPF